MNGNEQTTGKPHMEQKQPKTIALVSVNAPAVRRQSWTVDELREIEAVVPGEARRCITWERREKMLRTVTHCFVYVCIGIAVVTGHLSIAAVLGLVRLLARQF